MCINYLLPGTVSLEIGCGNFSRKLFGYECREFVSLEIGKYKNRPHVMRNWPLLGSGMVLKWAQGGNLFELLPAGRRGGARMNESPGHIIKSGWGIFAHKVEGYT